MNTTKITLKGDNLDFRYIFEFDWSVNCDPIKVFEFSYDDNNKLTQKIVREFVYDENGKFVQQICTEYDAKGEVVDRTIYDE